MKRLFYTLSLALALVSCSTAPKSADSAVDQRVEDLLSKMTLEEKIGQLNQLSSMNNLEDMAKQIREGRVGSILNEVEPGRINALQRIAKDESRLGIPILMSRDVIHGFKTIAPIPLGQAASFDLEAVEAAARIAAIEATNDGIRWTFSPMIDIARDARWGRIAEGYGEDTYLTSLMGAATIRGYQGPDLSDPTSMAACAKHFCGYGASEGGRDYNTANITPRQLLDVYLPPFQKAAEAGAATYMTSFNEIDGVPSTANSYLLKTMLRDAWHSDAMVVTDWASTSEMLAHGNTYDRADVAAKAINAGVDMEMVGETFIQNLPQLLKEGRVKLSTVDNAVRNVLRLKFRLGLFDNPYVDENKHVAYAPEFIEKTLKLTTESAILLKNADETLPLSSKVKTVALVGPMADAAYEQSGTWTFDGDASHTVTPLAALQAINGIKVLYEPALTHCRDQKAAGIASAVAKAKQADVVICVVGEEAIMSGEAHCLADINLYGKQKDLVEALSKTGKPLVTVIMAGRPLTIAKQVEESDALLYMFHPGTTGGTALVDLLFGKAVPSGKTPVTFPYMVGQVPIYYNHKNSGRPAAGTELLIDQTPVGAGQTSLGCSSYWLDAGFGPLFPFGYGLSYTTFEYSNLKLSKTELAKNETLHVTFDLANTGKYDATEICQLYIRDLVGSVTRPIKELKGFKRVALKAGEKTTVEFDLNIADLAFTTLDMKHEVEPGDFKLWVAANSDDITNEASFSVK